MDAHRGALTRYAALAAAATLVVVCLVVAPWLTVAALALATASLWLYRWRAARRPSTSRFETVWRIGTSAVMVLATTFVAIQFIPYGRSHENPASVAEPQWDTPRTRELAVRACFDCHSNETEWPWYATFAPASWMVTVDVEDGREALNFSEFDSPRPAAEHAAGAVAEGSMPPWTYRLFNSSARLTDVEKEELIAGLRATFTAER